MGKTPTIRERYICLIQEIFVDQLVKWDKGGDIWATAVLHYIVAAPDTSVPEEV